MSILDLKFYSQLFRTRVTLFFIFMRYIRKPTENFTSFIHYLLESSIRKGYIETLITAGQTIQNSCYLENNNT